jgi:hypothetical protein
MRMLFTVPESLLYSRLASRRSRHASRWVLVLTCAVSLALVFASDAGAAPKSAFSSAGLGSMTEARYVPVAAALPDGRVLIAGGVLSSSAELFDPTTGAFSTTGSLSEGRSKAIATQLPSGEVLIAGGSNNTGVVVQSSAELFNPATDTFSTSGLGSMTEARTGAIAASLSNGDVLIAGGQKGNVILSSAELFDPANDTFSGIGSMMQAREDAVAAPLPNGEVLIAGGNGIPTYPQAVNHLSTAELFDPSTDTFSPVSSMNEARVDAVAAPLPNGDALIAGGYNGSKVVSSAELFDPATDAFSPITASMGEARNGAAAAPLPNGEVLIAGGDSGSGVGLSSAEVFEPAPQAVTAGGNFGDQTVGEPAAEQSVTVTNVGAQPLDILSGVSLEGPGKAAFSVLSSTCVPGRQLTFEATCAITVGFTPPSAGAFSAQLVASDDAEAPISAVLSGTGVPANSGPTGSTGASGGTGASGNAGAAGLAGVGGATGPQGTVGNEGPAGKPGAPGREGAAGKVELVMCTMVPVRAKGKGKARTVQRCTTSLVSGPVSFTTGSSARATLSRRSHTYAAGTVRRVHGRQQVVLTASGALAPGRYTLTITRGSGKSRTTTQQTITIA